MLSNCSLEFECPDNNENHCPQFPFYDVVFLLFYLFTNNIFLCKNCVNDQCEYSPDWSDNYCNTTQQCTNNNGMCECYSSYSVGYVNFY